MAVGIGIGVGLGTGRRRPAAAAPTNLTCETAVPLAAGVPWTAASPDGADLWFSYTAPAAGYLTFAATDTGNDHSVIPQDGCDGDPLPQVGNRFVATSGQAVRVRFFNLAPGPLSITLTFTAGIPNDDCDHAIPLADGVPAAVTLAGGQTAWYTASASGNGTLTLALGGVGTDWVGDILAGACPAPVSVSAGTGGTNAGVAAGSYFMTAAVGSGTPGAATVTATFAPTSPPFTPADLSPALFLQAKTTTTFLERSTTPTTPAAATDLGGAVVETVGVSTDVAPSDGVRATLTDTGSGVLALVSAGAARYARQATITPGGEFSLWAWVHISSWDGWMAIAFGGGSQTLVGWFTTNVFVRGESGTVTLANVPADGWHLLFIRRAADNHVYVEVDGGGESDRGVLAGDFVCSHVMGDAAGNASSAGAGLGALTLLDGTGDPGGTVKSNMAAWGAGEGYV